MATIDIAAFETIYALAPAAKAELDEMSAKIAADFGGVVKYAPIKGRERAIQKIEADYAGNPNRIKDLARCTIIVRANMIHEVCGVLASLGATLKVIPPTSLLGYSAVNCTFVTSLGITVEIQVNSPEIIWGKHKAESAAEVLGSDLHNKITSAMPVAAGFGHHLYELHRVLDPKSPEATEIAEQSRHYYATIREVAAAMEF